MPKVNALVAGSTGYIGIQLIKLLVKHKYVNIKYLCGNSSVGKKISNYEKSSEKEEIPLELTDSFLISVQQNSEIKDISKIDNRAHHMSNK